MIGTKTKLLLILGLSIDNFAFFKDTAIHIGSKRPSIFSQGWIILLFLSIKTRNILEMETWTQAVMREPLIGASDLGILEEL